MVALPRVGPVEEVRRVSPGCLKVELTWFPETWEVGNRREKGAEAGPKHFALS